MTEQTSSSPAPVEGTERTPGRRSLPPKRGMLRRVPAKSAGTSARRSGPQKPLRQPISREDIHSQSTALGKTLNSETESSGRSAVATLTKKNFIDPGTERMKREQAIANQQEEQRKQKEEEEKKKAAEHRERVQQERELAQKRAAEIKARKKLEAEKRKAEQERLRREREAEERRLEEERLQKERELEVKRAEEEKAWQDSERQRILKVIETNRGSLNDKESEIAQKIAEEIVSRKIVWNGYISLTSGIGAAVLKD